MSHDRTHYPPGDCVGCGQPAAVMPLCVECRAVWERDGDCWIEKDSHSQRVRDLAAAWTRGYQRGWDWLPERPALGENYLSAHPTLGPSVDA